MTKISGIIRAMMMICYYVQLFLLFYMICCVFSSDNCSVKSSECGYKGECNGTICLCPSGYILHQNKRDCQSELCLLNDCVECPSEDKCSRCVNFISRESGKCIEQCNGKAKILFEGPYQGNVCTVTPDESTDIVIAIVAGVSASLLLLIIISLAVFFYMRKTR
ncbi:hypothetical protein LOTGIDRAFT_155481 [Lottia gigantea]|uniref:EGF-like domain-containing protein n=1 Tax=Lottia gigantea TaxID=225164 RepID=V3ZTC7_LOTGI|nr:hypothetical protein LOTGIDRAFT_155481 [Lottia gigantea]ESO84156.1 hypothetical protein LOTGIDRAFT_155481 [Lottia gigantea]